MVDRKRQPSTPLGLFAEHVFDMAPLYPEYFQAGDRESTSGVMQERVGYQTAAGNIEIFRPKTETLTLNEFVLPGEAELHQIEYVSPTYWRMPLADGNCYFARYDEIRTYPEAAYLVVPVIRLDYETPGMPEMDIDVEAQNVIKSLVERPDPFWSAYQYLKISTTTEEQLVERIQPEI